MDMRTRLARAIERAINPAAFEFDPEYYSSQAADAVLDELREPDEAMRKAGLDAYYRDGHYSRGIYTTMIDVARSSREGG